MFDYFHRGRTIRFDSIGGRHGTIRFDAIIVQGGSAAIRFETIGVRFAIVAD